jgi:hypothetical protein
MRLLISLALLLAPAARAAALPYFCVLSDDQGGWPLILESVGFLPRTAAHARIFVLRSGAASSAEWATRVESGAYLILEGESSTAASFGFHRAKDAKDNVRVSSLEDVHLPKLPIVWEKGLELPRYEVPGNAKVFTKERWTGAPMLAGFRRGSGGVLWLAAPPGERGYERFPYLLQALADLAFSLHAPLGILRFVVSLPRGSRLLRRALAQCRDLGPARSCLALLRCGSRARRLSQTSDRRLPR